MSNGNVTPFRRPQRRPPHRSAPKPQDTGFGLKTHRGRALAAHALTLIAFALNWLPGMWNLAALGVGVAAGAIALQGRTEAMPWASTHHEFIFRTLLIGSSILILSSLPGLVLPMLAIIVLGARVLVTAWAFIRSGVGLVLAIVRKPIARPAGWLL